RHTRFDCDWSSDVCSSDLVEVTKRAVPIMRSAGGGVICNVTSSSTLAPVPFLGTYRASKAAVTALGESLAAEVAQFGIRVIEIKIGRASCRERVETRMVDR